MSGGHLENIICPNCGHTQQASVLHTNPWWSYVHDCTVCNYTIMESEWETVESRQEKVLNGTGENKPQGIIFADSNIKEEK